jgi:phosphonopyruvate decarboxylase
VTLDPARFVDQLGDLGVDLFTGVPDSLLKDLCGHIMEVLPRHQHVITANEGAAVALAMGHHLRTGNLALVYLQNSGIGNAVNPLLSLADREVYGTPMLLLVGWRGRPGVPDEPQHVKQGRVMEALLGALDIPWSVLPTDEAEAARSVREAVASARSLESPYVLLVEKGTFAPATGPAPSPAGSSEDRQAAALPSREEALVALLEVIGDGGVQVATTGMLGRELFEYRQRADVADPGRDFLTVGGMGHACSIALGVAMGETQREVWCLDGDGAVLMHLGSLVTIADHGPRTLFHVVFNNGVHDSVGGQPTSIEAMDLPATATAMGYRHAARASSTAELAPAVADLRRAGGPGLLELRVRPGNRAGIGRPTRTPAEAKQAFMAAVR